MLTADLVCARRRGDSLVLTRLKGKQRTRALELSQAVLEAATSCVGQSREEVKQAWSGLDTLARERRLVDGLCKLVEDDCEFLMEEGLDPAELRRRVFSRASEARRQTRPGESFDRQQVLAEVATEHDVPPELIDSALYADLPGAQKLVRASRLTPEQLITRYESAQVQAVLLRAVKVTAKVVSKSPSSYRCLFHALKFRRLLHRIIPEDQGYLIEIDGPVSLFESVTKYGLQLALVLPKLLECGKVEVAAELRWGKRRQPLTFHYATRGVAPESAEEPVLPDEVAALLQAFGALGTDWTVSVSDRIFDLPGVGLCVPDLEFHRPGPGSPVYLEVLGYWSREAVWRRVELVQEGLDERILFAVSSRLRVSEDVLDEDESGALYVYKGTMSARAVLRRLELLAKR